MQTIDISLSTSDIAKAIRGIESYKKSIDRKANNACRDLANIGTISATFGFGRAKGEDYDYRVRKETKSGKVWTVTADGKDVAFIEFGAGEGVSYPAGYPEKSDYPIYAGSWSQLMSKSHQFAKRGYWFHRDKAGNLHKYYGKAAVRPMYNAMKNVRANVKAVCERWFG